MWSFKVDNIHSYAWIESVFSKQECEKIIKLSKSLKEIKATVGVDKASLNETLRKTNISWIPFNQEYYWVYQKLTNASTYINENYFKFDLFGFGEQLQLTHYKSPDGFHKKHADRALNGQIRKLSLSIQLSNPNTYKGGDLLIHEGSEEQAMKRDQGTLIAFPSFIEHEVTKVTKGERYSLVGWITGNNFK